MVSLIYSYDTGRVVRASTPEIRLALQIVGGITMFLSLVGACKSLFSQYKGLFSYNVVLPRYENKK